MEGDDVELRGGSACSGSEPREREREREVELFGAASLQIWSLLLPRLRSSK